MNKNIVLCGVGGQGTVLASKLIAALAMEKGLKVMSAETIGMAQRGGSVFSHLRVGENIETPMIGEKEADVIIAFEPAEAVRMLPFLKESGKVIVSSNPVMPTTASLSGSNYNGVEMIDYLKKVVADVTVIDTKKACEQIGSAKVMNVLLLGAAVKTGVLGFTLDDLKEIIKKRVPEKFHKINFAALDYEIH